MTVVKTELTREEVIEGIVSNKGFFESVGFDADGNIAINGDVVHEVLDAQTDFYDIYSGLDVDPELPENERHRIAAAWALDAVVDFDIEFSGG